MTEEQPSPLAQIWTRSLEDDDFRQRLIADPRTTLEDEMGLMLPEDMNVNVVENTASDYTIVLPRADAEHDADEVSGFSAVIYHIPEHNFKVDLRLGDISGQGGQIGFGQNPNRFRC